jgi:hypothetical protein
MRWMSAPGDAVGLVSQSFCTSLEYHRDFDVVTHRLLTHYFDQDARSIPRMFLNISWPVQTDRHSSGSRSPHAIQLRSPWRLLFFFDGFTQFCAENHCETLRKVS